MDPVDRADAASLLRARRAALLDQLDAVEKELAALTTAGITPAVITPAGTTPAVIIAAKTDEPQPAEPADQTTDAVVPTRVTPRRILSDEHRHALTEGRRKARHSKDAAAGLAREALDPAPGLAPASTVPEVPRLVKRRMLT
jgi:hypothetical protein